MKPEALIHVAISTSDLLSSQIGLVRSNLKTCLNWTEQAQKAKLTEDRKEAISHLEDCLFYLVEAFDEAQKVIRFCRQQYSANTSVKNSEKINIVRWLTNSEGKLYQATVEQCADSEGLTVEEYLAKEAEMYKPIEDNSYEIH